MPEKITTPKRKERVLAALKRHNGIVTKACKAAKIERGVFYDWVKRDSRFKKKVEDIQDDVCDFVEDAFYQMIKRKDKTAMSGCIFFLKTKGRSRGWSEHDDADALHDINIKFEIAEPRSEAEIAKLIEERDLD
jgi:hypothetical protein